MANYSFTFGTFTKDKFLNGIPYSIMTADEYASCAVLQNFKKRTFIGSIINTRDIGHNCVLVDIPYAAYTDPEVLTGIISETSLSYQQAIDMYEHARYYKKQELAEYIEGELDSYKGLPKGYVNIALYTSKKEVDGFTAFELDLCALKAVLKSIYRVKSFSISEQYVPRSRYMKVCVNIQLRVRKNAGVLYVTR